MNPEINELITQLKQVGGQIVKTLNSVQLPSTGHFSAASLVDKAPSAADSSAKTVNIFVINNNSGHMSIQIPTSEPPIPAISSTNTKPPLGSITDSWSYTSDLVILFNFTVVASLYYTAKEYFESVEYYSTDRKHDKIMKSISLNYEQEIEIWNYIRNIENQ